MSAVALRLPDAAAAVGMAESTFREHFKAGHVLAVYIDSHPRFTLTELQAWVGTWSTEPPTK